MATRQTVTWQKNTSRHSLSHTKCNSCEHIAVINATSSMEKETGNNVWQTGTRKHIIWDTVPDSTVDSSQ